MTFIYSSTCFGSPHAHHQELNNCSSGLWFYLRSVVVAVPLVVVGPARPRPTALLSPHSEGKIRGRYCSCWAPDDGREDSRNTCWAVNKCQDNKLKKLLHPVGDLFESLWTLYKHMQEWMSSSTRSLSSHQRGEWSAAHLPWKLTVQDDGQPQSLCPLGRERNLLYVPGIGRRLECPAGSLVTTLTELFWRSFEVFPKSVRDANWIHLAQESVWRRAIMNN